MQYFSLFFTFLFATSLASQTTYIGCVTDKNGDPLIGAGILVKETMQGTVADLNGCFNLRSDLDTLTLAVSYVGFETITISMGSQKAHGHVIVLTEGGKLETLDVSGIDTHADGEEGSISKKKRRRSEIVEESLFMDSDMVMSTAATKSSAPGISLSREAPAMTAPVDAVGFSAPAKDYSDGPVSYSADVAEGGSDDSDPRLETEDLPDAGQLTAGEINDFSKWDLWEDIREEDLAAHRAVWGYAPSQRFVAQLTYENGGAVVDASVQLVTKDGEVVFVARTDNQGRAELWANLFGAQQKEFTGLSITAKVDGETITFGQAVPFEQGINSQEIQQDCDQVTTVDVAFVVDATGSMGDEMRYLSSELLDVIKRSYAALEGQEVRFTSVYYRDRDEEYLTRRRPFGESIETITSFAKGQIASGGGDHPEAVESALDVALNRLKWSETAAARLLFLVLDAPPHQDAATVEKMQQLGLLAAKKGVKIIPVVCSGMGKDGEYLLRSLALTTNGTYTFLTDHSGIGGEHLEPTTDSYEVEMLNDLLVRLITQFGKTTDCQTPMVKVETPDEEEADWSVFPNPTYGPTTVKLPKANGYLFILDLNGKLLERHLVTSRQQELQLGQLPSGTYLVRWMFEEEVSTRKVVVSRA